MLNVFESAQRWNEMENTKWKQQQKQCSEIERQNKHKHRRNFRLDVSHLDSR